MDALLGRITLRIIRPEEMVSELGAQLERVEVILQAARHAEQAGGDTEPSVKP
jgi:hypothetical protein